VKNSIYTLEYQVFLKRLVKARKDARLTQVEVSKLLKQHQSYVSKCESGERRVDIIELMKFAKIYHKGIKYFISS